MSTKKPYLDGLTTLVNQDAERQRPVRQGIDKQAPEKEGATEKELELRQAAERKHFEQRDAALDVHERVWRSYLRWPGITAVDVGYRWSEQEGRPHDEVALRVHVKRKLQAEVLKRKGWGNLCEKEEARVPGVEALKEKGQLFLRLEEGGPKVPVDIIQAEYFPYAQEVQVVQRQPNNERLADRELLELARSPVNPLVGGVSIGNGKGPAGTLGAVVWDRTDGSACLLSNWHVLAGSPGATVGQTCFQPAVFDGGERATHAVAALKRWLFDEHGDAALAELACDRQYAAGEILGLWHPVIDCIEPELGMKVRKWGRSSGFTKGFIDGIHLATKLDYGSAGIRIFRNQIHIVPLEPGTEVSSPGDSGAVWVHSVEDQVTQEQKPKKRYYAVALHFAGDVPGSPFGEHAVASSMTDLAKELEFSLRPLFVPRRGIVVQQRSHNGHPQVTAPPPGAPVQPGDQADGDRPGGPQPIPEPVGSGG